MIRECGVALCHGLLFANRGFGLLRFCPLAQLVEAYAGGFPVISPVSPHANQELAAQAKVNWTQWESYWDCRTCACSPHRREFLALFPVLPAYCVVLLAPPSRLEA